ncbi:hypothetical protein QYM36_019751 [Artemia franciscana]|uniref:Uncharacterized protein n=1 Tax=Artemia franciscana TaxID=6661 RepID=A0AA88KQT0_ARTSF|nr:hypothetical protein QYM36_019751 [Artemia franciscana]
MCRYHLDILALSKVRWTGSREKQIDNHSTILYSGTKSRHEQGTAILPKILVERFTGRQAKLSVVVYYAPTNVAEDETKEEFNHTLQAVVNNIPEHDIMCVLGNLYNIVGNNESHCPQALGKHGLCA